jgi:hypothetical protein
LNVLVSRANRNLNRRLRVHARTLEQIQLLRARKLRQTLVNRPAHILWTAVRSHLAFHQTALDGEHDFLRVAWVLFEVLAEQVQGVALWGAVELAAVEEVGAVVESWLARQVRPIRPKPVLPTGSPARV